ncbi:hypothetical protein HYX02_01550 [Candidatus Woesearchaeota archaeon]|nr:hypothetical protein [Candidatus Woesearchaeota archaeon]
MADAAKEKKGTLENIVEKELPKAEKAHPEMKKTRSDFSKAYWLGELGGLAGSALLAAALPFNKYLTAGVASSIGNYAGHEIVATPYWYLKNTDRYKGLAGKYKFVKDWVTFNVNSLAVDIGAYLIDVPLAIGATALTGNPVTGTLLGGAVSQVLHWLGFRQLSKGKLKEIAEERAASKPYSPQLSYA